MSENKKIKLGDTEFDLKDPDTLMFMKGLCGSPTNAYLEYQKGVSDLLKVFDIEDTEMVDDKLRVNLKLKYGRMNPEYVEKYFPSKPEIRYTLAEIKEATMNMSETGVDVGLMVMGKIAELKHKGKI